MITQGLVEPNKIAGIKELLAQSWDIYKRKIWMFVGLFLAPILLIILGLFVALVSQILGFLLLVSGFILIIACQVASLYVIKLSQQSLGFFDYVKLGLKKTHSYLWVTIISNTLVGSIATITGVLMFIFIFVVEYLQATAFLSIVAVIFYAGMVLIALLVLNYFFKFIYTQIVLVEDDLTGISAVLTSKQYIQGLWWQNFYRLLPLTVVALAFSLLPSFLQQGYPYLTEAFSSIGVLFFAPFGLIYMYQTFRAIKKNKGRVAITVSKPKKFGILLLMLLGGALIFIYTFVPTLMLYIVAFIYRG